MDIIEMARELGAALQRSDEYTAYNVAKNAADSDAELQGMIGDFNLKKLSLNAEVQKEEKDPAKLAALNEEVRSIYARIMAHPTMMAYNTTKEELDRILNFIQQIIVQRQRGGPCHHPGGDLLRRRLLRLLRVPLNGSVKETKP